jgi:spermidine synthase
VLPGLEMGGTVALFAAVAAMAGSALARRPWAALAAVALVLVMPAWDARLYAVGVYLHIPDFVDPSYGAVRRYAEEGWSLQFYDQGPTGAVAVGRSDRTGNLWLSINGKVDASTGDDMPTQRLSGQIPIRMAASPRRVAVVGLASGVTAGAVLEDPRVERLTVVEIEPAVVRASRFFDPVSGRPLDDPRTELVVDDARTWLARSGTWDVIVSEPSNPWITGVSSLFTAEYWRLVRAHLAPDGVAAQWVQLYGMGPQELRALVRTFTASFPETWLFETLPGCDVLLVGGAARLVPDLPLAPRLRPAQVRAFGGSGWLNTDDHPRIEWQAPLWLHRATGSLNEVILEKAASGEIHLPGEP